MSIGTRDRTFREHISFLTTFFMAAFHVGAIAALFMFRRNNEPSFSVARELS